jgi:hypothetical protein
LAKFTAIGAERDHLTDSLAQINWAQIKGSLSSKFQWFVIKLLPNILTGDAECRDKDHAES